MRTLCLATAFVLLCAMPTYAQKVGDRIVVKSATAKLKMGNDLVGRVPYGATLTVKHVNCDWFWVAHSTGQQTIQGWIRRDDAIPLANAIGFFTCELRRRPTAEQHLIRGRIFEEIADFDRAIADYTAALRLDPDYADAYHFRGYAWACKGDDERAIADYAEFMCRNSTDETAYYNRGNAWRRIGEFDRAIADYTKSIQLGPTDGIAFFNRGRAWAGKGEHEMAKADFDAYRLLGGQAPLPLVAVVIEGNKRIAEDDIRKLIKTRPGQLLDPKQIKEDVRAIVTTRWFFDVEPRIVPSKTGSGQVLVFRVAERPILEKVTFIGNENISDKTITAVVYLRVNGGYDVGANREAVHRIRSLYREHGYLLAEVTLEKGDSTDDREVVFRIDEGARLKIRNIEFVGNKLLSDEDLRQELKVQPNAVCDHSDILADREKILVRYALLGRIRANVEPARRIHRDGAGAEDLVYQIEEGQHFELAQTDRTGDAPGTKDGTTGIERKQDIETRSGQQMSLREIDRLIFEGITILDTDDIRDALRRDFDLALAAHRDRPLKEFLDTLKAQLEAGFQHAGFPDVAVRAAVDDKAGRVVVQVTEGRRRTCGDVNVAGADKLPVEKLVQSLTEGPKPTNILWKLGGPAPCDGFTLTLIRERLKEAAGEAGFLSSQFEVAVSREPNHDKATLKVKVTDEGRPAVVGQIEFTGAKRDSREELLKYLDVNPGMPFDSRLPRRLERQLEKSGRYLTLDVTVTPSDSQADDARHEVRDLAIKLREYADAPKLAADLPPVDQALVKLGDWLDRWSKGEIQEDLVVTADFDAELPFTGASHATARTVIAPDRGQTIVAQAFGPDGKPKVSLAFAAYPDQLVLASLLRGAKLILPNSAEDRLTLKASGTSASGSAIDRGDQIFRLNLGAGWITKKRPNPSAFEVQARFTPAFLMSFAHGNDSQSELRNGVWIIHYDTAEMQIDAESGRLVSLRLHNEGDGWSADIRGEKDALESELQKLEGPLAAAAVEYDAASPWKSRIEFFVDAWLDLANRGDSAEDAKSLRALSKLVRLWSPPAIAELFDWDKPPRRPDDPFWIPSHLSPISFDAFFQRASMSRKNLAGRCVLPAYDRLIPRSSWLWQAGRDALLTWASDDPTALASLHQTIGSRDSGPVGAWMLATAGPYLGLDLSEKTGLAGIKRLAAEAFRREYRPLLARDSWLGRWFLSLGRALRSLDESEIHAVVRLLPAEAPCDAALGYLHSLKRDPSQTIEQAAADVLDGVWVYQLQTELSSRLRRIAASAVYKRVAVRQGDQVRPAGAEVDSKSMPNLQDDQPDMPQINPEDDQTIPLPP